MSEHIINDKWVLDRISSQSSSFTDWLNNVIDTVQKSVKEITPKSLEKVKQNGDIASLKDIDRNLAILRRELPNIQKELGNIGFLERKALGFGTDLANKIVSSVHKEIKSQLETELDLDFLMGKQKNLSSALYDVSKERGIDSEGILYLLRALPDLEAFLYSTSVKKYYRDHTEHALRVAVLGDFLLEQDLGQGELAGVIADLTELEKNVIKDKFWWIAGLIHDIGYPLSKMTTAINYSLVNQLLKCYPTLDLEFIPLEIGLSWKGSQEAYLKIIEEGLSKEARSLIRIGTGIDHPSLIPKEPQIYLKGEKGHPEYEYTNPINLDHGVISALSLLNSLGTPDEIKNNDEYSGYILVAKAMAIHNFKAQLKEYTFDKHPLAFFLLLIDELQEWGRPIPIKVRDTYFTTELEKITLLDEIVLYLDDFNWLMKFKNKEAENLMGFNFKTFSNEKKNTFNRLNRGNKFSQTKIQLQDIKTDIKPKKKEQIVDEITIII
ncbi:MAG: hypothetical protein ACFFBH_00585 [Promethearchaeota archaeon]